jgi:sigma-B regulation protein RsbU (phosphoserine phosphatase)
MEAVNNDFRSIFGARSFMTQQSTRSKTGSASVVGAGHPPLLVARRAAPAELVSSTAPPLGLLESSHFEETSIELQPGDGFLLYTDGLYGASKVEAERWTPARLQALLTSDQSSAQALLGHVIERAVPDNGEPLADDLAALVVRRVT